MPNAVSLILDGTAAGHVPAGRRLPDPLPVTDFDPIRGFEGCGWCGKAFTIYQVYVAVMSRGELWGYAHQTCMDALRAGIRP
jgi:hypothetical protein